MKQTDFAMTDIYALPDESVHCFSRTFLKHKQVMLKRDQGREDMLLQQQTALKKALVKSKVGSQYRN